MEALQGEWDTEVLRYGKVSMLEMKENYYMELSNTITTFNYNINTPLSNTNI